MRVTASTKKKKGKRNGGGGGKPSAATLQNATNESAAVLSFVQPQKNGNELKKKKKREGEEQRSSVRAASPVGNTTKLKGRQQRQRCVTEQRLSLGSRSCPLCPPRITHTRIQRFGYACRPAGSTGAQLHFGLLEFVACC